MITRGRLVPLGLLGGLFALGLGGWLLWPRTAITPENAAKIREGMTLLEVEAILGGPGRNESTGTLTGDDSTLWLLNGYGRAHFHGDGSWDFAPSQDVPNQASCNSFVIITSLDDEARPNGRDSDAV